MREFLSFFSNQDWFGRSGPFGYNTEKIIFIIITMLLCVFIPMRLKGKGNGAKKTLIAFWIFALTLDIVKYIFYNAYCYINDFSLSRYELPFWTCTIFLTILPLSLFSNNEKIKASCNAFICSISFVGGIVNYLFPQESIFSFMGLHTFLYHFILTIVPLIMLISGYYKPKFKHCLGAVTIFIVYAIPVFIIDNMFEFDYMFIYNGTWLGPLSKLAALIPYNILWTLICLIGHIIVAALIVFMEELIINRNQKVEDKQLSNILSIGEE